jgi:hypothetical protein
MSSKRLPCVFFDDVRCPYRKSEKVKIMSRCFKCPHLKEFEREMEREEDEFWDEVDRMRREGWK